MQITQNTKSKLVDCFLAAVSLILINLLVALMVRPIELTLGKPGLLVYTICLVALSMIALDRSILLRFPETKRAAWGMLGGLLVWSVLELSTLLSDWSLSSHVGLLGLLVVSLAVVVLWKRILPIGVKFYLVTLLAGWSGYTFMRGEELLMRNVEAFENAIKVTGFITLGFSILVSAWIITLSKTRLQRMWGALILWFLIMTLLEIFRGGLY